MAQLSSENVNIVTISCQTSQHWQRVNKYCYQVYIKSSPHQGNTLAQHPKYQFGEQLFILDMFVLELSNRANGLLCYTLHFTFSFQFQFNDKISFWRILTFLFVTEDSFIKPVKFHRVIPSIKGCQVSSIQTGCHWINSQEKIQTQPKFGGK